MPYLGNSGEEKGNEEEEEEEEEEQWLSNGL